MLDAVTLELLRAPSVVSQTSASLEGQLCENGLPVYVKLKNAAVAKKCPTVEYKK